MIKFEKLLLVPLALYFNTLFAEIWYVDTIGIEGESLQVAINLAWLDPGIDTVSVANGCYYLAVNADTGLIMKDSVVLMSQGGAECCTLTALKKDFSDTAKHVVYCNFNDSSSHTAVIKGFTITGRKGIGPPLTNGGGIYCCYASPNIEGCRIIDNDADNGAGIYLDHSSSKLTGNIIQDNTAWYHGAGIYGIYSNPRLENDTLLSDLAGFYSLDSKGGGLFLRYSSFILIDNNIDDNIADYGAGIYAENSSGLLTGNLVQNNQTHFHDGGGIYIKAVTAQFMNNVIQKNTGGASGAAYGGGVYIGLNSSTIISNDTIRENYSGAGGGFYIDADSVTLINCVIQDNVSQFGGGLAVTSQGRLTMINNLVLDNEVSFDGGGLDMRSKSVLKNNVIDNNSAWNGKGGGINTNVNPCTLVNNIIQNNTSGEGGGGIFLGTGASSSLLSNNAIINNSAQSGGGVCIVNASPRISNNFIYNNFAYSVDSNLGNGGAIWISSQSSPRIRHCVIAANKAYWKGGALYTRDNINFKAVIDSCLATDNGCGLSPSSMMNPGLLYMINCDTVRLSYSHVYYNTYQSDNDIEIWNSTSVVQPLENNYWWDTTESGISSLIQGFNDHEPWLDAMVLFGVPGEPTTVGSVINYDHDYSMVVDSVGEDDTLYLGLLGVDRNPNFREAAVVILKSNIYSTGIAVALTETDTNSGVYHGEAYPIERSNIDLIRTDDIWQNIGVRSTGDTIWIVANVDTTKRFPVSYKAPPVGIIEGNSCVDFFFKIPNPVADRIVLSYHFPVETTLEIDIYDIAGRRVGYFKEKSEQGYNQLKINTDELSSGVYFLYLKLPGVLEKRKIVVAR